MLLIFDMYWLFVLDTCRGFQHSAISNIQSFSYRGFDDWRISIYYTTHDKPKITIGFAYSHTAYTFTPLAIRYTPRNIADDMAL